MSLLPTSLSILPKGRLAFLSHNPLGLQACHEHNRHPTNMSLLLVNHLWVICMFYVHSTKRNEHFHALDGILHQTFPGPPCNLESHFLLCCWKSGPKGGPPPALSAILLRSRSDTFSRLANTPIGACLISQTRELV